MCKDFAARVYIAMLFWVLFGTAGLSADPQSADATAQAKQHYQNAVVAIAKSDWQIAKTELVQAEKLAPSNALVHYDLALAYSHTGQLSLAKAELNKALQLGLPEEQKKSAEELQRQFNQAANNQVTRRGSIGVSFDEDVAMDQSTLKSLGARYGVVIESIEPGSPAEKAGLKDGDVITTINGHMVKTGDDLVNPIASTPIGSKVKIIYYRDKQQRDATVTVEDRTHVFPGPSGGQHSTAEIAGWIASNSEMFWGNGSALPSEDQVQAQTSIRAIEPCVLSLYIFRADWTNHLSGVHYIEEKVKVPVNALDPQRVEIGSEEFKIKGELLTLYSLRLETTNHASSLEETFSEISKNPYPRTWEEVARDLGYPRHTTAAEVTFFVKNDDLADRMKRAFGDLIRQCGGKIGAGNIY